MGPVYQARGLSVGAVTERLRDPVARRAAYACDVTYVTSKQVAFDYLRDGLERRRQKGRLALRIARLRREPQTAQLLLRGLCFGVVDEADSVLIDEARTPLILSGPAARSDSSESTARPDSWCYASVANTARSRRRLSRRWTPGSENSGRN